MEKTALQAIDLFTDREEPRSVFHKKYADLKDSRKTEPFVINYYGYGGVGKSSLLEHLNSELLEKDPDAKYAFLNFKKIMELGNNPHDILKLVEYDLKSRYKFSFPLFDLASYTYETRLGRQVSKPELESVLNDNKILGFAKDVIGEIPIIGSVSKIVDLAQLAERGKNLFKDYLDGHKLKDRLKELDSKTGEEIKAELGLYFAIDLAENIKDDPAPFVFFIDTYELLVNEFSIGDPLENDLFIRGDDGLVKNSPHTLWVIAGREMLRWKDLDKSWNSSSLDQHILAKLSFKDAKSFFNKAGIDDEDLIHELYDLTSGAPIYLDLCRETYLAIKNSGKAPKISDFGDDTNSLAKRFLTYMDDNAQDLVHMLAHLDFWTDENIEGYCKALLGSFSPSLYERVKNLSFVAAEGDQHKIIDDLKDVIVASTPAATHNKYLKLLDQKVEEEFSELAQAAEDSREGVIERSEESPEQPLPKVPREPADLPTDEKSRFEFALMGLALSLSRTRSETEFETRAKTLLDKALLYEKTFNREINLRDLGFDFLSQFKAYSSSLAYLSLACFYSSDPEKTNSRPVLDLVAAFPKEARPYLERLFRFIGDKTVANFEELAPLGFKELKKTLFLANFYLHTPKNHPDYQSFISVANAIIETYSGEPSLFFIELALESGHFDLAVSALESSPAYLADPSILNRLVRLDLSPDAEARLLDLAYQARKMIYETSDDVLLRNFSYFPSHFYLDGSRPEQMKKSRYLLEILRDRLVELFGPDYPTTAFVQAYLDSIRVAANSRYLVDHTKELVDHFGTNSLNVIYFPNAVCLSLAEQVLPAADPYADRNLLHLPEYLRSCLKELEPVFRTLDLKDPQVERYLLGFSRVLLSVCRVLCQNLKHYKKEHLKTDRLGFNLPTYYRQLFDALWSLTDTLYDDRNFHFGDAFTFVLETLDQLDSQVFARDYPELGFLGDIILERDYDHPKLEELFLRYYTGLVRNFALEVAREQKDRGFHAEPLFDLWRDNKPTRKTLADWQYNFYYAVNVIARDTGWDTLHEFCERYHQIAYKKTEITTSDYCRETEGSGNCFWTFSDVFSRLNLSLSGPQDFHLPAAIYLLAYAEDAWGLTSYHDARQWAGRLFEESSKKSLRGTPEQMQTLEKLDRCHHTMRSIRAYVRQLIKKDRVAP